MLIERENLKRDIINLILADKQEATPRYIICLLKEIIHEVEEVALDKVYSNTFGSN